MMFSYLNELKERAGNPSNAEIAEKSGMQESTVSRMLAGNVENPRFQTVVDLVVALGGSLDVLVGLVKQQPNSVTIENPIDAVEKVMKVEEEAIHSMDDAERQGYKDKIQRLMEEAIQREEQNQGNMSALTAKIEEQREVISQQNATIREQQARLEAKMESIQHRDQIIAEKDQEIQAQKGAMRRQATRYIIVICLLIVGVFYLCWDGTNPNKGFFQYGQIVPVEVEGKLRNVLVWIMDRLNI